MLPEAFLNRMRQMLGSEYEVFLAALEGEKYQALRLNPLKRGRQGETAAEALRGAPECGRPEALRGAPEREQPEALRGVPECGQPEALRRAPECEQPEEFRRFRDRLTPVPWAENGYYYEAGLQPGKHPYHEAGVYYIQEPSAMAPAELLEVRPGERVLDLCAAPGGKSTQLAAKLKGRGLLLCNEIHPARANILSENIERMGISNACVTNAAPEELCRVFSEYFDKILVDAPCSGEGMFRKSETACEEWSPENVTLCAGRQDQILDCAARMLRRGGRLVYSTCTFSEQENEGSIERFLQRHPDFRPVPIEAERKGLAGCEGRLAGTIRLMPHKARGEGHFAAVLERQGAVSQAEESNGIRGLSGRDAAFGTEGRNSGVADRNAVRGAAQRKGTGGGVKAGFKQPSKQELEDYLSFCRENLKGIPGAVDSDPGQEGEGRTGQSGRSGVYIRFGDNLYLAPGELPDLSGIKVLRPGLHLGELKKNRFEPSHALALALSPEEAAHVLDLGGADAAVSAYLNGQTFSAAGEKGWYLICVDGFSAGWGKLAGGIMKNHYPRGLRRNYMPYTGDGAETGA